MEQYLSKQTYDITTNNAKGLNFTCVFLIWLVFLKPKGWIEEQINAADVKRPDDLMAMLPRNLEAIVPGAQQPIQSQPVIPDTQSSDATTGGDTVAEPVAPADDGTQ